jgi:hypothetical protein
VRALLPLACALAGCAPPAATTGCGALAGDHLRVSAIAGDFALCTWAQANGRARVQGEDSRTTATFSLDVIAGPGRYDCRTEDQVLISYTDASGQTYLASSPGSSGAVAGSCSVTATTADLSGWVGTVSARVLRTPDLAPLELTADLAVHR